MLTLRCSRWILIHIAVSSAVMMLFAEAIWSQTPQAPSRFEARVIKAWLQCDECESGELSAVVRLGGAAVPMLAATLEQGVADSEIASMRHLLAARYEQLAQQGSANPKLAPGSKSNRDFVERHVLAWQEQNRTRAAQALIGIGGPNVRNILQSALSKVENAGVRAAINRSLLDSH
jgi:hypothetical protein